MHTPRGTTWGVILLLVVGCAVCNGQSPERQDSDSVFAIPSSLRSQLRSVKEKVDLKSVPDPKQRSTSFVKASQVVPTLPAPRGMVRQVAGETVLLPIATQPLDANVNLAGEEGLVNLVATGAELKSVLRMIADHHGLNLVIGPEVSGPVTVSIRGAQLDEVLDAILGVAGFSWHRVGNLLYVTGASAVGMDPRVQGRRLQVYPLDYVSSTDVEAVANGLLSPVGNAYVSQADRSDQLKTREILVVEDTAAAHQRIAQYISQIDIAPRQVLVEAHVLQIALTDEERHGINLKGLADVENSQVTLEGSGFADETPSGPALTLRVNGSDMQGLIEMIRANTNSRTLASPKLSVVNHQEAKIQIGQRLPYSVSTTTQTTTVQSVEFLDVGIVLTVRPIITADGNVLMEVLPKVSGGKITQNGFPEEETTEVQTTILMQDGGGVIIGGLIREDDIQSEAFVPIFGRMPIVGKLFRRQSSEIRRNELIVALVTHVMLDGYGPRQHEVLELEKTIPDYSAQELLLPSPTIRYQD
ncbi:MAG: type II secretion system protein GspD [Rubripirellula sp.]